MKLRAFLRGKFLGTLAVAVASLGATCPQRTIRVNEYSEVRVEPYSLGWHEAGNCISGLNRFMVYARSCNEGVCSEVAQPPKVGDPTDCVITYELEEVIKK